jgi:isoleucyl-tRNA synthetase
VADELNVRSVDALTSGGDLVDVAVKANFRALGKVHGKQTPVVAAAIAAAVPDALVAALRSSGSATVEVDGAPVTVGPEDVIVSETPRAGWAVASGGAETVALDLELTHELRLAGLVRDIVRTVQDARKNAGLEVTDRIELWWQVGGSPEPGEAIRTHAAQIGAEVLAAEFAEGVPPDPAHYHASEDVELGLHVWFRRAAG